MLPDIVHAVTSLLYGVLGMSELTHASHSILAFLVHKCIDGA